METLVDPYQGTTGVNDGTEYDAGLNARHFASDTDDIQWPNVQNMNGNPTTVSMWVNVTDLSTFRRVFLARTGDGIFAFFWGVLATGNIRVWHENDAGADTIRISTGGVVTEGQWHHVTVSYDGLNLAAGIRIYVDCGS